ncbi:efflux RND transporter permease subunit [Terriglobus tenax]|uniref:efflux RND transporter permease subunit n=1 Tax=Terriglobus tenax TaxID=1111115 RepID=UPI0021E0EC07|nr:efflux RND transporter permease subunit [Terriglobus tenax]
MWIVKLALNRPYTFIVLALLILLLSPVMILRTPTDIFPNINIPVIAVAFQYSGLNAEEVEGRLTTPFEKVLTTLVDNIEHIESTSYNGVSVIKVYLQPNAHPDTANAQVTAAAQSALRQLPPGILPPLIVNFSASSVPILQIGVSGEGLSEQVLNDNAQNVIRTQLVSVPGAQVPFPFGGKQRQVSIAMDQAAMQSKGIAPGDLLSAIAQQNVVSPSGTIKIGTKEYDVTSNAAPRLVEDLQNLPVKQVNGTTIYVRDLATVSDGAGVQSNVVRQDGRRGVLITVYKNGDASTLDVVSGIKRLLPRVQTLVPDNLKMTPLGDQSIFVRSAVQGVIREAIIAAALTGLMILLFLGSWRSTLIIAVSIPLSILTSVIVLGLLGETINTMTLGGLALAVGILVDDATVTIENIERFLEEGQGLHESILEGAAQISVPALVSTLCICIVFLPMFFLSGVSRYLFVPLAEAVVFAMLASYMLSRTLVPTLAMYLLKAKSHHGPQATRNPLVLFQRGFERVFETVRNAYHGLLEMLVTHRKLFIPCFLGVCLLMFLLIPFLGQDFFPSTDSGQFILHVRAPSGTRIEDMARLTDQVESHIRQEIPQDEMSSILDNIGLPFSQINTTHLTNGTIGPFDGDVMVSLKEDHHPTDRYVAHLRRDLPKMFPGTTFYFLPADITTQILNFGLPAPIDVQFEGSNPAQNHELASKVMEELRAVPGLTDLRIQQPMDYPTLKLNLDRTKALQGGFTATDVTTSLRNTLSGSFQVNPIFFLNWKNNVNYNVVAQTPQYKMDSLAALQNIPLNRGSLGNAANRQPETLNNVATVERGTEMATVNHYNIRRVVDIYGAVQGRDLGSVSRDINKILDKHRKTLPKGVFLTLRGQVETMKSSYIGLIGGLAFSIVLVYLLIVVNFQSWVDPFIIITALPAALAGIVLFLFITATRLSVPALMGAIMCMGVATANSILVVSFAKLRYEDHGDAIQAATEAGFTRFRPVMMTALAMIIGMVPMALGMGDGGEQNAPLGRAVIGGLMCATVATLVFVPTVFALIHGRKPKPTNVSSTESAEALPA